MGGDYGQNTLEEILKELIKIYYFESYPYETVETPDASGAHPLPRYPKEPLVLTKKKKKKRKILGV